MVHGYPPYHNAGAEWMLHDLNKFLVKRGHDVLVLIPGGDAVTRKNGKREMKKVEQRFELDGVRVEAITTKNGLASFKWCDLVVTHLDMTGKVMNIVRRPDVHKPIVHLLHNTHHNHAIEVLNPKNQYVVYNAEWNRKENRYKNRGIVVHPPVAMDDYKVIRRNAQNITLVNCWKNKGGNVLVELAKTMPDHKFLGVMGGYGDQTIGRRKNLKYEENTPDIKSIYRKTRIIIMPSEYESWGRVAVEAMCSGIPVIAHPTPGLKESLDFAGLFAHRDRVGEWQKHIEDLDDPEYYDKISTLCKRRAAELDKMSHNELYEYEKFLHTISQKGYAV